MLAMTEVFGFSALQAERMNPFPADRCRRKITHGGLCSSTTGKENITNMNHEFNLQLFAEGGAPDATASGAGESATSANQPSEARLRELGVPEERLQKRAKRAESRKKGEVKPMEHAPMVEQMSKRAPETKQPVPSLPQMGRHNYDIRSHYDSMNRQAAEMAQRYPDFNLQKELDNPTFLRLTGPEIGLPLEDAYMAMHHRELTRAIAERSRQELSNAIRAGSSRPTEHGMGAKAPSVVTFDYKNATKSQRAAFKKQIFDAAARGEKIYPAR